MIPDQPAAVALLELADSSSVSSSISKCNFASCSRLSFSSAEDLFAHIRSKHVLEFEKEFGSRQRLAAFGTLVPLSTQVPPTYVDESALSEDFGMYFSVFKNGRKKRVLILHLFQVKQYVHTPDNKLVWFSRPPVDVLPPQPRLVHSAEFLKFKETETPETEEQPQPMVVDEVAAVENEKYQERLKEVEAANWLSLLKSKSHVPFEKKILNIKSKQPLCAPASHSNNRCSSRKKKWLFLSLVLNYKCQLRAH